MNSDQVSKLTPWPREFGRGETVNEHKVAAYDRQRADAAMERLKLVVDELSEALAAGEDMDWTDLRNRMAYIRMMIDMPKES